MKEPISEFTQNAATAFTAVRVQYTNFLNAVDELAYAMDYDSEKVLRCIFPRPSDRRSMEWGEIWMEGEVPKAGRMRTERLALEKREREKKELISKLGLTLDQRKTLGIA